jgi:hypothetical protein
VVVNDSIASFSFSPVLFVIRHHSSSFILVMVGVMLIADSKDRLLGFVATTTATTTGETGNPIIG